MKIHWPIFPRAIVLLMVILVFLLINFLSILFEDVVTSYYDLDYYYDSSDVKEVIVSHNSSDLPYIPSNPFKTPVRKPADIPRRFLIEEKDFCRRRDNLQVVSYVHSAISRVDQRRDTRRTWANSSAFGINIAVVFMVGRAKNYREKKIVEEESRRYHDIVQGNYADHYHLLSYKALASLHWITRHCSHVPWTLHADDDLLVDTFLLQKLIHDLDDKSKEKFICKRLEGWVLRRGKWQVREEEYPRRTYPSYCQGIFWLLATHQVPKLLQASKEVDFLWVDDAYITGVLAEKTETTIKDIDSKLADTYFERADIGKNVAWYHVMENREELWKNITHYYKKLSAKSGIIDG
ncbi:beta-1,3-galactosyltransferase 2-like isoform X2 [Panulirus ornatus]|uniref:beta-1,3-galactosyltransferase 2-like isoform X2 n=1 Tax=Panulirus ornatus TaxID=150431 RepID=UPI003A8863D1